MTPTPAQHAEVLISLIQNELDMRLSEVDRRVIMGAIDRFCAEHADTPPRKAPQETSPVAMNSDQAKAFEQARITYGIHSGKCMGDIPIKYLCWLGDPTESSRNLQQYLRSDRGKRRIEEGE